MSLVKMNIVLSSLPHPSSAAHIAPTLSSIVVGPLRRSTPCSGRTPLLVCGSVVPCDDVFAGLGVARRQHRAGRDDPELDLAGQPALADHVPSGVVEASYRLDVGPLGVQRGVHGAVREVGKNGLAGSAALTSRIIRTARSVRSSVR